MPTRHLKRPFACRFDEFFDACKGCHFDFLATHLYTCSIVALQRYINESKKYGLPIWLTEFACPNGAEGPVERQLAYMAEAVGFLQHDRDVARFAWFAPRTGGDWLGPSASLLQPNSSALTQLGSLYMSEGLSKPLQQDEPATASWTGMCSSCFEQTAMTAAATSKSRELCQDCGFWSL